MPLYGALPVVLAVGINHVGQWSKPAAAAVFGAILVLFASQELAWYQRLAPDTRSPATLECFSRNGVKGALADYWLSYKLTFLSGEQVIVAPTNGVDRYPPYTAFVRSLELPAGHSRASRFCYNEDPPVQSHISVRCALPYSCRPLPRAPSWRIFHYRPHAIDQGTPGRRAIRSS